MAQKKLLERIEHAILDSNLAGKCSHAGAPESAEQKCHELRAARDEGWQEEWSKFCRDGTNSILANHSEELPNVLTNFQLSRKGADVRGNECISLEYGF